MEKDPLNAVISSLSPLMMLPPLHYSDRDEAAPRNGARTRTKRSTALLGLLKLR